MPSSMYTSTRNSGTRSTIESRIQCNCLQRSDQVIGCPATPSSLPPHIGIVFTHTVRVSMYGTVLHRCASFKMKAGIYQNRFLRWNKQSMVSQNDVLSTIHYCSTPSSDSNFNVCFYSGLLRTIYDQIWHRNRQPSMKKSSDCRSSLLFVSYMSNEISVPLYHSYLNICSCSGMLHSIEDQLLHLIELSSTNKPSDRWSLFMFLPST